MTFAALLRQLDVHPATKGRDFERLCKWFLASAPEYRSKLRKVWLWNEWPGAWGPDAGIDLVAEERTDGALWAIQAKAYAPGYTVKKRDVDSFLAESSRGSFSYRLLIATTDLLGHRARATCDGQRVPVGYVLRSKLEQMSVDWPAARDQLTPRTPRRKKPRPHQQEALRHIKAGLGRSDRGQLVMACGTGKTLVALWASERLGSVRTLVLVPALSLLAQTLTEWSTNATKPFEYLAVCSDVTVVGGDSFVQHVSELGLPVTTDPSEIAAFMRRPGRRVVFATYQSSPQIAAAHRQGAPPFDLAVADEAHRCAGRVSGDFATVLNDKKIKSARRLFMTATPRLFTPRVQNEAGQVGVEVASMDDEAVFGRVVHKLSFQDAIDRDLLSDYQVVVMATTNDEYRSLVDRGELVALEGSSVTSARTLARHVGLGKAMRKYKLRRVISFHSRVARAREFSSEFPGVVKLLPRGQRPGQTIWCELISGDMSTGQRERRLRRFREIGADERAVLTNARCLTEGVDIPTLDAVAFVDPRRSVVDTIQAVGRAIRKAPNKEIGTLVIPVLLADWSDPELALEDSSFDAVWNVLKALRAHDELLASELDDLRRRIGRERGPVRRPGKIKLDLPTQVTLEFVRSIDARLVEQTTASWEFWYGLLERFVQQYGTARVPPGHAEGGQRLGAWITNQRTQFKTADFDSDRRRRLETLPGWTWRPHETSWEEGYAYLTLFAKREGHVRVDDDHVEDGFRLGKWVGKQRARHKAGRLQKDRGRALEALPGWSWDPYYQQWGGMYEELQEHVKRGGAVTFARGADSNEDKLARWVTRQRQSYQRGELHPDRQAALEQLPGWAWDKTHARWEAGYVSLQEHISRHGTARVPIDSMTTDGFAVGQWVVQQRNRYVRGTIDTAQRNRLEVLDGWAWNTNEEDWAAACRHLEQYANETGHARVPADHVVDGFQLGRWVSGQRVRFRRGRMDPARQHRLEAIAGWTWSPHEAMWDEGYAQLLLYVEREGHARVPADQCEDGFRLGTWVANRRKEYRHGRLAGHRAEKLAVLPGWTWAPRRGLRSASAS